MIEYRYRGVPHSSRPGIWLAQFQAPGLGTRYVRDEDGATVRFKDEESANRAALAVLMRSLNGPPRAALSGPKPAHGMTKTMTVKKTGRFGVVFRTS